MIVTERNLQEDTLSPLLVTHSSLLAIIIRIHRILPRSSFVTVQVYERTKNMEIPTISSIDLRNVPVYIVSPRSKLQKYVRRREIQRAALVRAGFTSITTVYGVHDPLDVVAACSLGHALLIETALTQLRPFRPFLILEDDALPEDNIRDWTLRFPSDCDAFYPSMASDSADLQADEYVYTFDSTFTSKPAIEIPGGNMVRIFNMLTAHACLVLTLPWALNWLRCATEGAARKCGFDVLTAYTMKQYQVYAQLKPWFYQAEVIGGKEFETRLVLNGVSVSGPDDVPESKMNCTSSQIAKLRLMASLEGHVNKVGQEKQDGNRMMKVGAGQDLGGAGPPC